MLINKAFGLHGEPGDRKAVDFGSPTKNVSLALEHRSVEFNAVLHRGYQTLAALICSEMGSAGDERDPNQKSFLYQETSCSTNVLSRGLSEQSLHRDLRP